MRYLLADIGCHECHDPIIHRGIFNTIAEAEATFDQTGLPILKRGDACDAGYGTSGITVLFEIED